MENISLSSFNSNPLFYDPFGDIPLSFLDEGDFFLKTTPSISFQETGNPSTEAIEKKENETLNTYSIKLWNPAEDQMLIFIIKEYIEKFKELNWVEIGKRMVNSDGVQIRTWFQCRRRWTNYLSLKTDLTTDEAEFLAYEIKKKYDPHQSKLWDDLHDQLLLQAIHECKVNSKYNIINWNAVSNYINSKNLKQFNANQCKNRWKTLRIKHYGVFDFTELEIEIIKSQLLKLGGWGNWNYIAFKLNELIRHLDPQNELTF